MASVAEVFVTVLPATGKIASGIEKALRDADDGRKRRPTRSNAPPAAAPPAPGQCSAARTAK